MEEEEDKNIRFIEDLKEGYREIKICTLLEELINSLISFTPTIGSKVQPDISLKEFALNLEISARNCYTRLMFQTYSIETLTLCHLNERVGDTKLLGRIFYALFLGLIDHDYYVDLDYLAYATGFVQSNKKARKAISEAISQNSFVSLFFPIERFFPFYLEDERIIYIPTYQNGDTKESIIYRATDLLNELSKKIEGKNFIHNNLYKDVAISIILYVTMEGYNINFFIPYINSCYADFNEIKKNYRQLVKSYEEEEINITITDCWWIE